MVLKAKRLGRQVVYAAGIVCLVLVAGCEYDVEEELAPEKTCDSEEVSYRDQIEPILSARCYQCHAAALNQGNVTLEGYDRLKILADNGRLLGAVQWQGGFSPMPQNEPMLPECDIDLIQAWVEDGAPNN